MWHLYTNHFVSRIKHYTYLDGPNLPILRRAPNTGGGTILKIEVLPGKKLKATYVDATQAQKIARGQPRAVSNISKDDYNNSIIEEIDSLFDPGIFVDVRDCDELIKLNFMRPTQLYAIDTLNGFTKISELLASVTH
jgi:hypothetical protein